MTAYEKKESSATNNRMDTADTSKGKRNDTATPQDTASADKVTESSEEWQEQEEKFSPTPSGNTGSEEDEHEQFALTRRDEAVSLVNKMENDAEIAPEIELTISNWDTLFGEEGIVKTPLGEVKMGENQFAKLMRQGRDSKLGMIKPTLENPDVIIEASSEAKEGSITERASSYIFVKAFRKSDGSRYYYFTSVTVSKEGKEVVVSSQEKSRNRLLRLLTDEEIIWRTPKDATTSSAEGQGLDYVQSLDAETATKGSGLTPQRISTADKVTESSEELQGKEDKFTPAPIEDGEDYVNYAARVAAVKAQHDAIKAAENATDTNPTDGQKKAGNYKKGHVQIGAFDISVEQPKGSVRRGKDADGKEWESKMNNTYGYFRGTEGVDGDHIDVFLSNDIDGWNGRKVFVVDQYNPDGKFDEHKVMLGFNDAEDAKSNYLANYEKGWENGRRIDVSTTNLEDFEKWISSSYRKTKPFAEYKGVRMRCKVHHSSQVQVILSSLLLTRTRKVRRHRCTF